MSTLPVFDVVPEPATTNPDSTISGEPLVTLDAFGTSETDEEKEAKLLAEENRLIEQAEKDLATLRQRRKRKNRNRKTGKENKSKGKTRRQQPSF